jgi:hypothetical protein
MLNIKNIEKLFFRVFVFLNLIYIENFLKINIINASIFNASNFIKNANTINIRRGNKNIYGRIRNRRTLNNDINKTIINRLKKNGSRKNKNYILNSKDIIEKGASFNRNEFDNKKNNQLNNENSKRKIDYNNFALFFNIAFSLIAKYLHIYNNLLDLIGAEQNINTQLKPIFNEALLRDIDESGKKAQSCFSNFYINENDTSNLENIKNIIINQSLEKNNYKNTIIEKNQDAIKLMNQFVDSDFYKEYIDKILKIKSNGEIIDNSLVKIKINSSHKDYILQNLEPGISPEEIIFSDSFSSYEQEDDDSISKFSIEMTLNNNYDKENEQILKKEINGVLSILSQETKNRNAIFLIFIASLINEALKNDNKNVLEKIKKIIDLRCKKENQKNTLDIIIKALDAASTAMKIFNEYTLYYNNFDCIKYIEEIAKKNIQINKTGSSFNFLKAGKWLGVAGAIGLITYLGSKNLGWTEKIPFGFGEIAKDRLVAMKEYFGLENIKKNLNNFNNNNSWLSKAFKIASINPTNELASGPISKAYNIITGNDYSLKRGFQQSSLFGDIIGEFSSQTASSKLNQSMEYFGIGLDFKFLNKSLLKEGVGWIIKKFFLNTKMYTIWTPANNSDSIFYSLILMEKLKKIKNLYMKLFTEYQKTSEKYSGYAESVIRVVGRSIERNNDSHVIKQDILKDIINEEMKKYIAKLIDRAFHYDEEVKYLLINAIKESKHSNDIDSLKNNIINRAEDILSKNKSYETSILSPGRTLDEGKEYAKKIAMIEEKYNNKIKHLKGENFKKEFFI